MANFDFANFLSELGPLSLFFIILIEEAGVPLPISGDLFLLNEGRNSLRGEFGLGRVLVATIFGTIIGASFLYVLSRSLGRTLIMKYGRYIRIREEHIEKIEVRLQKYGMVMVMAGRLLPGLRIVTTVASGIFNIRYFTFLIYTLLGTVIWAITLFWAGRFLGEHFTILWKMFLNKPYITIPGTLFGASIFVFVLRQISNIGDNHRRKK